MKVTRRKLLFAGLGIAGASFVGKTYGPYIRRALRRRRENILLIICDAMRGDVIGKVINGQEVTPNLNKLAAEGTCFLNAYSASSFTKTSMASIFSGIYAPGHGVESSLFTLPDCPSIARYLAEKGYYCAGIAANPFMNSELGVNAAPIQSGGFGFGCSFSHYPNQLPDVAFPEPIPSGLEELGCFPDGARVNMALSNLLEKGVRSPPSEDQPLFIYLHYMDSHQPWLRAKAVEGITGRFHGNKGGIEELYLGDVSVIHRLLFEGGADKKNVTPEEIETLKAVYHEASAYADRCVGEALNVLEKAGMLAKTTVILTSDHGDELMEHGNIGHAKNLFNTSLHVPLIVKRRGGRRCSVRERVSNAMIFPTIAEWFGDRLPAEDIDSLSPYLCNRAIGNSEIFATLGNWDKLISPDGMAVFKNGKEHLFYNVDSDAAEREPLPENKELLEALSKRRNYSKALAEQSGVVRRFSTYEWQNEWAREQNRRADELVREGTLTPVEAVRLKSLGQFIPEKELERIAQDVGRRIIPATISEERRKQLRALGYLE